MTGRIAITLAAFVAGLTIASLASTSSAAVCDQLIVRELDQCKCPLDKMLYMDVRPCVEDLENLATHRIPDIRSLIDELAK